MSQNRFTRSASRQCLQAAFCLTYSQYDRGYNCRQWRGTHDKIGEWRADTRESSTFSGSSHVTYSPYFQYICSRIGGAAYVVFDPCVYLGFVLCTWSLRKSVARVSWPDWFGRAVGVGRAASVKGSAGVLGCLCWRLLRHRIG